MDNELTTLLAEKLGLACEYVEANGAEIFSRYIKGETIISELTVGFSILICIIGLIMLIYVLKGWIKGNESVCNFIWGGTGRTLTTKGGVLVIVGSVCAVLGFIFAVATIGPMVRWLTCPEIQAISSLGL